MALSYTDQDIKLATERLIKRVMNVPPNEQVLNVLLNLDYLLNLIPSVRY